jgi:hypothetical protein
MTQSAFPQGNTTTFTFIHTDTPLSASDSGKGAYPACNWSVIQNKRHRRYGAGEVVLGLIIQGFVAMLAAGFVMTVTAAVFLALQ